VRLSLVARRNVASDPRAATSALTENGWGWQHALTTRDAYRYRRALPHPSFEGIAAKSCRRALTSLRDIRLEEGWLRRRPTEPPSLHSAGAGLDPREVSGEPARPCGEAGALTPPTLTPVKQQGTRGVMIGRLEEAGAWSCKRAVLRDPELPPNLSVRIAQRPHVDVELPPTGEGQLRRGQVLVAGCSASAR
jgi:hypothetical protein